MSSSPSPIVFFFDYISPYAYLAWTQIHALAERHGRGVEPIPILFAGLLNTYGNKGPAEIPPKRIYIFKDVLRSAHKLGVPLSPPPSHPFNPLLALRTTSLVTDPASRRALIDELYRITWAGGPGVTDPEVVAAAADRTGLDGKTLVAQASSDEAKVRVKRETDDALARGAFGVPTMIVDQELFWGLDAFGHLEDHLRGLDPVNPERLAQWAHIQPSANRIKS